MPSQVGTVTALTSENPRRCFNCSGLYFPVRKARKRRLISGVSPVAGGAISAKLSKWIRSVLTSSTATRITLFI